MKWKKITGYDYYVSSTGLIKNFDGKLLTQKVQEGYRRIGLYKNGRQKFFCVHRLVAAAFIPNSDKKRNQVNHKNHKRDDNRVCNLEWVTNRENSNCKRIHKYSYEFLWDYYMNNK